jgi:hypothetical protein
MGKILDYYLYTETVCNIKGLNKRQTTVSEAINMGIVDKDLATIQEFLEAKNEEIEDAGS